MIQYNQVCSSNLSWRKEVKGSKGETYEVHFGPSHGPYQYDWECSCPAFKYGRGKHCKHIEQAKKEKCDWNKEGCYTGSDLKANPDGTCPKCGGETEVIKVAV